MKTQEITFCPIGVVHPPHKNLSKTPVQPVFLRRCKGNGNH